jgi:type I restriction enzyme S subunit
MNEQWQQRNVGDILRLEYGKPLPKSDRKVDGKYPIYGANGEKERTDSFYHDRPSIIVGRKGSAGELAISNGPFWPLDVTYFVVFDEEQYELQFLYHLLTFLDLPKLAKGVKPGINRNDVYALGVKVPPIAEQKRIVRNLDEAFKRIEIAKGNVNKNLQNARSLVNSYLHSVFTQGGPAWERQVIEDVCNVEYGTRVVRKRDGGKGFPVFGGGGATFEMDSFNREDRLVVARFGMSSECTRFVPGKFFLNDSGLTVSPKSDAIHQRFLDYQLAALNDTIYGLGTGTAQKNLNVSAFRALTLLVPESRARQIQLVTKFDELVDSTKRLSVIGANKLAALDQLKNSLLYRVFHREQGAAA